MAKIPAIDFSRLVVNSETGEPHTILNEKWAREFRKKHKRGPTEDDMLDDDAASIPMTLGAACALALRAPAPGDRDKESAEDYVERGIWTPRLRAGEIIEDVPSKVVDMVVERLQFAFAAEVGAIVKTMLDGEG